MAKKFNPKSEITAKILIYLTANEDPKTFGDIAKGTGVRVGDLQTHIDHLSRTGHVESVSVARDKRYKIAARGLSELEKAA